MAKFNTAERAAITRDEFIERLRAWAPGKLKVMAAQAERDRRIAEATKAANDKFQLTAGALKAAVDAEEAALEALMDKHPEWFPAGARSIDVGNAVASYRTNPARVEVVDVKELIKYSDESGLDLYVYKFIEDKAQLRKLLKKQPVPGARLVFSETARVEAKADNLNAEQTGRG